MQSTCMAKHWDMAAQSFSGGVKGRVVLIPEMHTTASRLFAATFRSFDIEAEVLETDKGRDLGKAHTSGKECYPCQVTLGDILYFARKQAEDNGCGFHPEKYVYFLPNSGGPCRFGMYSTYQRIVLDSYPELRPIKIVSPDAEDGYSFCGLLDEEKVSDFRKAGFFSFVIADILDRVTWRIRPYEKEKGMTDDYIADVLQKIEDLFERHASKGRLGRITDRLAGIVSDAGQIVDPHIPEKPKVGIVGEIFLRMHTGANQNLIRSLETHGAEVVNASLSEWVNFVAYKRLLEAREGLRFSLKKFDVKGLTANLQKILAFGATLMYQESLQKKAFNKITPILNISPDHKMSHLRRVAEKDDTFTFQVGTETCISIAAILEYVKMGFDGVVNVYPLTCMPGMATSAIIKPLMNDRGIPYIDTPYDGTLQPGREAATRTFVYQAEQHFRRKKGEE